MAIIGTLPNILLNGTIADASQVMADFNFIVNQVNANAIQAGTPITGSLLNVFSITSSQTYTPNANMGKILVLVQAGGGAGGGATTPGVGNVSIGAPGSSGSLLYGILTSAQVGGSQVLTVGAGGVGVIGGAGNPGGTSSFGALINCPGGAGGNIAANIAAPSINGNGGLALATGTGTIYTVSGQAPFFSQALSASVAIGAAGGLSFFGPGGTSAAINTNGNNANNNGAGGSGAVINSSNGNVQGGNGKGGIILIYEYV